jgi:hypothetical protein
MAQSVYILHALHAYLLIGIALSLFKEHPFVILEKVMDKITE